MILWSLEVGAWCFSALYFSGSKALVETGTELVGATTTFVPAAALFVEMSSTELVGGFRWSEVLRGKTVCQVGWPWTAASGGWAASLFRSHAFGPEPWPATEYIAPGALRVLRKSSSDSPRMAA